MYIISKGIRLKMDDILIVHQNIIDDLYAYKSSKSIFGYCNRTQAMDLYTISRLCIIMNCLSDYFYE